MRRVTQATIFSGRQHCVEPVVDALLALDYPNLRRLWLSTSPRTPADMLPARNLPSVEPIGGRVFPQLSRSQADRLGKKQAICVAWRALIERAIKLGDDLLVVEDDIVVPRHAVWTLQGIADSWPAGAVSGVTQTNSKDWPFYEYVNARLVHFNRCPPVPTAFCATGTFCMYLRADVLAKMKETGYRPAWNLVDMGLGMVGKDCHLGVWLRENGFSLVATPDVSCRHHVLDGDKVRVLG